MFSEAPEKSDPQAPYGFLTIDNNLRDKNLHNHRRRLFFLGMIFFVVISTLLYLLLPFFHLSSIEVSGLVDLDTQDVLTLSGKSGFSSYLFVDEENLSQGLLDGSQGLILSAKAEIGVFKGKITVEEDHPVARIGSDCYLLSGTKTTLFKSRIEASSLSLDRKESLLAFYNELEAEERLPEIHFPKDVEFSSLSNPQSAFVALESLSRTALDSVFAVEYLNPSNNATWNNLCNVLISGKQGEYYCLSSLLCDQMKKIFQTPAYPKSVLSSLENYVATKQLTPTEYRFADDDQETYSVYSFKAQYRESDGKVRIYYDGEEI